MEYRPFLESLRCIYACVRASSETNNIVTARKCHQLNTDRYREKGKNFRCSLVFVLVKALSPVWTDNKSFWYFAKVNVYRDAYGEVKIFSFSGKQWWITVRKHNKRSDFLQRLLWLFYGFINYDKVSVQRSDSLNHLGFSWNADAVVLHFVTYSQANVLLNICTSEFAIDMNKKLEKRCDWAFSVF